ncbi:diguanylate cyclase [Methylocystis heyeri]|uniref:diguanylate cyclase n=1 Tax=Methylocystis heyeri TaxID=391905 RepID=A0A6B8KCA9_9HYPH|nr:diguanylate cyclase [Methylocystis heyeri]QGM45319.1 diguanylate cyclase [Methylocystis heyeri]
MNAPPFPTKTPRILIVDDQPINIQLMYDAIRELGEVFFATSGEQALAFCAKTPPDLVLLDVEMPGMDGYEVCRRLKEVPELAQIPVIFVTARGGVEDEVRALEAGGVDFITKPVNLAVARARVKTHLALKAQSDFLRNLASMDGLTGIANRRQFDRLMPLEWRYCQRHNFSLGVLMIDVDHFKLYNDRLGHQSGDACLQSVAATITKHLRRPHDLAARYGGEEFICLMPETDSDGAEARAEEIRAAVERLGLPHPASETAPVVTVSVGAASASPGEDVSCTDLTLRADQALYAAKAAGRNQVCLAERNRLE